MESILLSENNLNIYSYGSRVYGTYNNKSDYDYIVIVKNKITEQFSNNKININYYTVEEHQQRLDDNEISALETFYLDPTYIIKKTVDFKCKIDLSKLRHSLSAKSSNSFVKAKKKLTVQKDYDLNIGKKSLFHSFRIIYFGIQLAKFNKIADYSECNNLYNEIMSGYDEWDKLFETYKKKHNELLTEFRILAPK